MNWYALYTKPRWEKKVLALLTKQHIEAYLPTKNVLKQYSDRRKKVDELILPSYIFVHIAEAQKPEVRYTSGIVNFVYWLGQPAIIRDKEIELLKEFLALDGIVYLEKIERQIGDQVQLKAGAFKGQLATITKINKNITELILDSLQIKLTLRTNKDE
jgi:transcription antitermination factor NusG